ncbi:DsbA family protein [Aeromicrobium stalagmiti]|uniref:DsbA family protein n=1 Tax=Aeromicrobium stalagmiti TaxID=2738988 RepID=UPI00156924AE|nr:thioredoxin domain-containing protein [Aeromicrobium stalagmiti]NRQ51743.1 thioredoxin domain-containing protein [Aeromicrobium stalagmiti]
MMRTTFQTKITVLATVVSAAIIAAVVITQKNNEPEPVAADERTAITVREDSHRLDTVEDGKVTLVEFLDFECEACGAAYPVIEDLREQYEGRVTFVIRYFPIPSHTNAKNAAYAVESAARQGKLEDMYRRMYDTQAEWGESQDSKADLFRTYAEELGLDMAQFDADVSSPDVAARVQKDIDDGTKLGVSGTPSFFLNGEPLVPETVQDFTRAIDDALAS